jgi:hypothetical protein
MKRFHLADNNTVSSGQFLWSCIRAEIDQTCKHEDPREEYMSYVEARNHFQNATNLKADEAVTELANGLKHLSHAIEEDIRTLEQDIRNLRNQRAGTSS